MGTVKKRRGEAEAAAVAGNNARPRNRIKLRDNAEHNLRTPALYYVPLRNNTPVRALDEAIHAQFLFGPRINVAGEFLSDDNSTRASVSHARFTVHSVNLAAPPRNVGPLLLHFRTYIPRTLYRAANEPAANEPLTFCQSNWTHPPKTCSCLAPMRQAKSRLFRVISRGRLSIGDNVVQPARGYR